MTPADIAFYIDTVQRAALRSKAVRLKVGAAVVNEDHIMAIGYNGTPKGWDNCCEDATSGATLPEVIHAELNALKKFNNNGLSTTGTTMFITHSPCMPCSQLIYLARVRRVYFCEEYRSLDGINFLRRTGIDVVQYPLDS